MTGPAAPTAGRREWVALAVLALPCLLYSMDLTVLFLALPRLTAVLRPSSAQLLWITDSYGFMLAGFLITMGTLGDRIGRRRLLQREVQHSQIHRIEQAGKRDHRERDPLAPPSGRSTSTPHRRAHAFSSLRTYVISTCTTRPRPRTHRMRDARLRLIHSGSRHERRGQVDLFDSAERAR